MADFGHSLDYGRHLRAGNTITLPPRWSLLRVPPGAFTPPPKVDSAVVLMRPLPYGGGERLFIIGTYEQLFELVDRYRVSTIAVCLDDRRGDLPLETLLEFKAMGTEVRDGHQLYEEEAGRFSIDQLKPSTLIFSEGFRRSNVTMAVKRLFDIAEAMGADFASLDSVRGMADTLSDGPELDLVVNNIDAPAFIYEGIRSSNENEHYLQVKLEGESPNRRGIGAQLIVTAGGQKQYLYHSPYRGYMSTMDDREHVGLGRATRVDSLEVIWPDGRSQVLANLGVDRIVTVRQRDAGMRDAGCEMRGTCDNASRIPYLASRPFQPLHSLRYTQPERSTVDFEVQPLLPYQLSRQGPALAVADVNRDGLDDVHVAGETDRLAGRPLGLTTTAGNTSITLNSTNNSYTGASTFAPDGTSNVTLVNNTATNLAASTINGNLSVSSSGAITDSGNLSVGGTSSFATTAGESLAREAAPRDLSGFVDAVMGRLDAGERARASWRGNATGFAILGYLTAFYVVAQRYAGAWFPAEGPQSEIFNMSLPFLAPLTISVVAAATEETTYRLLGISLVKRYAGSMALALLLPAVVWAFGHSNYPVFPVYLRGIELTIGGVLFGLFAGIAYWFPKAFGFKLDPFWGKMSFWFWVVGFYFAFMPLYVLGLMGVTRRVSQFEDPSLQTWFIIAAFGAVLIAIGIAIAAGAYGIHYAARNGAFPSGEGGHRYVSVAKMVEQATDPSAIVITGQHSGPTRYYAGRTIIRYELLDPAWLDRALEWLVAQGRRPFFLLEEYEVAEFEKRFSGAAHGRVALTPIVAYRAPGVPGAIYLFDPARPDGGALITSPPPEASRTCVAPGSLSEY